MSPDTLNSIEEDYSDIAHASRLGHRKHIADVLALCAEVRRLKGALDECAEAVRVAVDEVRALVCSAVASAEGAQQGRAKLAEELAASRKLVDTVAAVEESAEAKAEPVTVAEVGA